jgi:hypothetical protein
MAYHGDDDNPPPIVDNVNDPVVADPDSVAVLSAGQFLRAMRTRIRGESIYFGVRRLWTEPSNFLKARAAEGTNSIR